MGSLSYQELVSKRTTKAEERICKACGKPFTPISYTQRGKRFRLYCYRPECELAREKEHAKKVRERARERARRKRQNG